MRLRVLIVDDEPLARASLRACLGTEPEVEIVGECADGHEALAAIRERPPHLVLLDVDMPGLDGFRLLQEMAPAEIPSVEMIPSVIFVTAHDEHAVRAFDVNALDYLVKPFGLERFRQAFRRARTAIEERDLQRNSERLRDLLTSRHPEKTASLMGVPGNGDHYLERLTVKSNGRIFFVRTSEIDWIKAEGNYLRLHVGSKSHLIRETMNGLEQKLDPQKFLRVHRSTIVNFDKVKEMRPWAAGDFLMTLKDGTELKLSRSYREKLEELTGEYT
jgi:two-component system LytT family response regulator